MELRYGDMWEAERGENDVLVVTTNGFVKKSGQAVMGRGIARQVRDAVPGIDGTLGQLLTEYGNRPFRLTRTIWSLPVKYAWNEAADLELIGVSLAHMGSMVEKFRPEVVHMPRPGCGNGRLDWTNVQPVVEALTAEWKTQLYIWTWREK